MMTRLFCSCLLLVLVVLVRTADGFRTLRVPSPSRRLSTPRFVGVETMQTVENLNVVEGSLLSQLDTFWQTCPYQAAALVCGFKGSLADVIAQSTADVDVDVDHTPDLKRNAVFLLYGALYQGLVHEYVFNTLYPAWFGTGTELSVVLVKVLFNLLIQTTLVTLPVAYLLKAVILDMHSSSSSNNPLQAALDKYWQDIQHQHLLTKCFALWGPVQCITFSIVPEHYRVTFIALVSFFWLILLSHISNAENPVHPEEAK
jgi:Mpv17 / PMP22 family